MQPLVSIITVYYNRKEYINESIQSLLDQTYENTEILIVDDGSSDGTLNILNRFSDNRIRIISHENMGFVRSIKKAIDMSKGEYIAIHGSGDISHANRIERQLDFLVKNLDVGVVSNFAYQMTVDGNRRLIKNSFVSQNYIEQLLDKSILIHGSAMFRKDIYYKAGGYREFFKFGQDRDLWLRMCEVTKPYVLPEILYTMYILPGSVSDDFDKRIMQLFFQSVSNQCVKQRRKSGNDIVYQYGFYAPFFRKRDKVLALKFARTSIVELSRNNYVNAIKALEYSKNEKNTLIVTILLFIIKIGETNNYIKNFVISIAKTLRRKRIY